MSSQPAVAPIHRLHPVRVLVVGPDRRFLRLAQTLLGRSGFVVETAENRRNLNDRIVRDRINVVIIDASNSVTAAARTIAALAALPNPVSVVTVADRPARSTLESLRILPKWSDFGALVGEVEAAYAENG